jgi:trehalose synthase
VFEVHVSAGPIEPFAEIVGQERIRQLERAVDELRGVVGKRVVWNVNTAASGGGVAEMLRSFLRYARGLDVDVRWLVFEGPPEFFRITKRVHNALHGSAGDGSPLGHRRLPRSADRWAGSALPR